MRHFGFLFSCVVALTALPAIAQQTPAPTSPGPGYGYGYGPMMWNGGWGYGWFFGPFLMLIVIIGAVALIIWLVRAFGHTGFDDHHRSRGRTALDILEERFARGEIDKAEFEEKRKLLGR